MQYTNGVLTVTVHKRENVDGREWFLIEHVNHTFDWSPAYKWTAISPENVIRIECGCTTCTANAERLGLSAPLAATASAAMVAAVNGHVHSIVHAAHDPSPIGIATRNASGIHPA